MGRRKALFALKASLPLLGEHSLPPEFNRVAHGSEWGPGGRALWMRTQCPQAIIAACLSFLASHLTPGSVPPGVSHGDPIVFQRPPVMKSTNRTMKNGVCLVFSQAKTEGLRHNGRYRQLVLGKNGEGSIVVIGAHRLICWAVHGVPHQSKAYVCHATIGCENRLPCCSPLHLQYGDAKTNRRDVELRKSRLKTTRARNLTDRWHVDHQAVSGRP